MTSSCVVVDSGCLRGLVSSSLTCGAMGYETNPNTNYLSEKEIHDILSDEVEAFEAFVSPDVLPIRTQYTFHNNLFESNIERTSLILALAR